MLFPAMAAPHQWEPAILIRTVTAITSILTRTGTILMLIPMPRRKLRSGGSIATSGRLACIRLLRPLVVGLVHGLAGSAAVALLVLTTIRNPKWAVAYLLVFGVGTIAGMMLITGAMVIPFAYADNRFARLNHGLRVASGLISIAFGLFLVYEIGFVNGLFTSHPQWTPR